jgi:hypothetical protein
VGTATEHKGGGVGGDKERGNKERGAGQRGGTKGVEQRVGVSRVGVNKDCIHWATGQIWVAHFVWEIRSMPGPPIQRGRPGTHRRTRECTGKPVAPNRRRRVYVGVKKVEVPTAPKLGWCGGHGGSFLQTHPSMPGRLPLCD